jgi:hypothetical protein
MQSLKDISVAIMQITRIAEVYNCTFATLSPIKNKTEEFPGSMVHTFFQNCAQGLDSIRQHKILPHSRLRVSSLFS